MSKLALLRSRLGDLRRRRQRMRWGVAGFGFVAAVIGVLAAALLLDWTFEPARPQRLVALLAVIAALAWSYRRLARPWLGLHEDDLDMALLVERQQHIDSDLVAALQFESPAARGWGSAALETAVIDYVADFGNDIRVDQGFDRRPLVRRAAWAGAGLVAATLFAALLPGHAGAFLNRLFLGRAHYPTRTIIASITVAGQPAIPQRASPERLKCPAGQSLVFTVAAGGELPAQGNVELRTVTDSLQTTVELLPLVDSPGVFQGNLPRLVDTVDFQVYLGDAWTDPLRVYVIPLPVVNVSITATPPEYASAAAPTERSDGYRQVSVLEGSRVELEVACGNKPLRHVRLEIGDQSIELVAADESRRVWKLPAVETPLGNVTGPLSYSIQVEDDDGLTLETPIAGFIRIKADRNPRVQAEMVTRRVLPTARPLLTYEAADDYGVAQLRLRRQVLRAGGDSQMEEDVIDVPLGDLPEDSGPQTQVRGSLPLDLRPLKLAKGDQVKITLEATDYRGPAPGRMAHSESLLLDVTDQRGVLAGMIESDERAARQIDSVIQRQMGVGEAK